MTDAQNRADVPRVPTRRRALALSALAGVLGLTGWGGAHVAAAANRTSTSCQHPQTVQVAAPTAIVDAVRHAAQAVEDQGEACVSYQVNAQNPGDTYRAIVNSSSTQPQVWISDSPAWTQLIENKLGDGWVTVGNTIATSPVVLGVPKAQAAKATTVARDNWAQVLHNSSLPVSLVDPDASTASLLHVVAATEQAKTVEEQRAVAQDVLRISRTEATADGIVSEALKRDSSAQLFPVSEQQVISFNTAHPDEPMTPVVPKGGAPVLTYQWVTPVRGTSAPTGALSALERQLLSPGEAAYRAQQGFRDPSGHPLTHGALPAATPMMSAATDRQVVGAYTAWGNLKKDARMLVLADVSGSMLTPVGPGSTRISLLEQTALSALNTLPQTTRMGVWAFSSDLQKNHVDYLPLTNGEQPLRDAPYKATLQKAARALPALAARNGDTALYDSIAAAFKSVNDTYDPNYINSVVVLTDGKNDDPNGGLDLTGLLSRLQSQYDVDKPVKIVTIAIGGDTDPAALKKIALATGGLSYTTTSADQIASVFIDAFLHRADY